MEGLLIAETLAELESLLPAQRQSWRFVDAHTFVLPLGKRALWFYNKPPHGRIELESELPSASGSYSGFQDLLLARANGPLLRAEQLKLDRVVKFHFDRTTGFVETAPVTLVAELTGRNSNLVLLDEQEVILGVAREVGKQINRFRQLRTGLPYTPPPPYEKLDPRTATREQLVETLKGEPLKSLRKHLDGIGPELTRTLSVLSGLATDAVLDAEALDRLLPQLDRVVREPAAAMRAALKLPDLSTLREREWRQEQTQALKTELEQRLGLTKKRLDDIERLHELAQRADELRKQADVLMAYAHTVEAKANRVILNDFEGQPMRLELNPRLSARENAQAFYTRAKKT